MSDIPRKKTLDELRSEAIAEFERRGYDVRGKTPAQIRRMLRARRPSRKPTAKSSAQTLANSHDKQNQPKCGPSCAAEKKGRTSSR
jgi:hypothetical protein